MSKRIIVIGGGPAGLMAAAVAAKNGCSVTLFEKNKILGRKLLITGKGRCNVTNFCESDNVIRNINSTNPKFMFSALNAFNCYDTYSFFEELSVPLKIERGNRVFPLSDKASDIRDGLKRYAVKCGVDFVFENVNSVLSDTPRIITDNGTYSADSIIIATGGLSYPATGSTGDGYRFARSLGHRVTALSPSLVGLLSSDLCCSDMSGLSLKNVAITLYKNDEVIYTDFGEMLFTHHGVSGPIILSASAKTDFKASDVSNLYIDLKPALSYEELDNRIIKDFTKYSNKDFLNSLNDLLPRKIIPYIVERSGIDPRQKVNSITKEQRRSIVEVIKSFVISINGKAGFDEAIITSGGVDLSQVDPKTMQSKYVKGFYFAGEVLDIDCNTGGYNLQVAFSTGYVAGMSASMEG